MNATPTPVAFIGLGLMGGQHILGPPMVNRDFAAGFFVEHFIQDLRIAHEESVAAGLDLTGLITALRRTPCSPSAAAPER
jgi:3-hydroxyisobutyrate dehydrogenase